VAAALVDALIEGFPNKYWVVRFSTRGNFIEVMYNLVSEDSARVKILPTDARPAFKQTLVQRSNKRRYQRSNKRRYQRSNKRRYQRSDKRRYQRSNKRRYQRSNER
jgi:hypothetical protein